MSTVAAAVESGGRPAGARERLLRAADELFYAEGINTVGIDRVIEHAGVAKASLYSTFGSKDQLIRAYLERRHERRRGRIERLQDGETDPRKRMLAIFASLEESFADPSWHGCPFLSATGESRTDATVREVASVARAWLRQLLVAESERLDVADPAALADQLIMLYDGAIVAWQLAGDPEAATRARSMAAVMIERAI